MYQDPGVVKLNATPGDNGGHHLAASPVSESGNFQGRAKATRPRTQPTGAEEGTGLLFRNGAFVVSVRYTLVAFENDRQAPSTIEPPPVVYTAVLHFDAGASEIGRLLDRSGQVFALETTNSQRWACRPVEALGSNYLRWIVRLTPQS